MRMRGLRVLTQVVSPTACAIYRCMSFSFRYLQTSTAPLIYLIPNDEHLFLKMSYPVLEAVALGDFCIEPVLQPLQLADSVLLVRLRLPQLRGHLGDLALQVVLGQEQALLVLQELGDLGLSQGLVRLQLRYLSQVLVEELNSIDEQFVSGL